MLFFWLHCWSPINNIINRHLLDADELSEVGRRPRKRIEYPFSTEGCENKEPWSRVYRGEQGDYIFGSKHDFKIWCRWFRYAPLAVVCRNASARYTRFALLALWVPPLDKTIFNCFICANPAGGAILGAQFDNSNRKSLIFKDFFGF